MRFSLVDVGKIEASLNVHVLMKFGKVGIFVKCNRA